jgi:hypothetical protein
MMPARLDIRRHTDQEFDYLPHAFLTSVLEWDPTVIDDDNIDHQHQDIDFLTNRPLMNMATSVTV